MPLSVMQSFQAPIKLNRTSNANAAYRLGARLNGPIWTASVRVSMRGDSANNKIAENATFVGFNCGDLFYRIWDRTVCVDWINDSQRTLGQAADSRSKIRAHAATVGWSGASGFRAWCGQLSPEPAPGSADCWRASSHGPALPQPRRSKPIAERLRP